MKRSRWSSASFNSLKALELSMPPMKPSKRSTKRGSCGVFLAKGLISSGYSVMNTGWMRSGSTRLAEELVDLLAPGGLERHAWRRARAP